MKITWFGTASVSVETEQTRLLFDPFVPWKGSPAPIRLSDYDGFSDILVTHGHFDHLESLPKIIKRNPKAAVFATKTPCAALRKLGVPAGNLRKLRPGKKFRIGDISIRTWQSRHADLQFRLADRMSDPRLFTYFYNLPSMLSANLRFKENNEILMYELHAEGKTVFLLGSMNLSDQVEYPSFCDLLILPYVGYFDNYAVAMRIIGRLGPKKVILSHFDDTFPPMTRAVDLSDIRKYKGCRVFVPEYKKPVEL